MKADELESTVGKFGYITSDQASLKYAQIDFANVTGQVVGTSLIKDGAITDAKILSLSANKLTAGIIDAAKITVTNLNADNITVGRLNGKLIGTGTVDLDKLVEEVPTKEYLDSVQNGLQDQIDKSIQTYTVNAIPLLSNEPAQDWNVTDYQKHVGDVCYVMNPGGQADGYTYRFEKSGSTYGWTLIKDSQVTEALQKLIDVDGNLSGLKSFQSETNSWITKTDSELSSVKSRTTTIETTYSTKAEAKNLAEDAKNGAIDEAAKDATSKATSALDNAKKYADDTVDGIEVGGRNLLSDSKFDKTSWKKNNDWISIDNTNGTLYSFTADGLHTVIDSGWGGTGFFIYVDKIPLKYGTPITVSMDLKIMSGDVNIDVYANTAASVNWWTQSVAKYNIFGLDEAMNNKGKWVRVGFTTIIPSGESMYMDNRIFMFRLITTDGEYFQKHVKIEVGNKATDWTPALEDIEQAISTKVETTAFNEVKQTVDSNTAQITQMTKTLEQKADGSAVESLQQTVNSVQQTANENISKISQVTKTLEQKADGSAVESLTKRTSSLEQNLSGFKSSVSSTYVDKTTYASDKKNSEDAITNVRDKLKDYVLSSIYETYVEQTDKAIELRAKQAEVDAITQRLSTAESTIGQLPDKIELKVSKDGIISAINQTAESIKINASKIDLSGYVTIASLAGNGTTTIDGSNIKTGTISADRLDVNSIFAKDITATGTITGVTLNGATGSFSGTITSGAGKIGGWNIGTGSISYSTDTHTVTMAPMTNANGDFLVVYDKANNTWPFFVRADGFHAYQGEIGGFNINSQAIYYGNTGMSSIAHGVYVGRDGIRTSGTEGTVTIAGGSVNLSHLCINGSGSGSAIFGFTGTGTKQFEINYDGSASFNGLTIAGYASCTQSFTCDGEISCKTLSARYAWLGSESSGWYEVTNDRAGRLYCRYKDNAAGDYKYTSIANIMDALSGKAASGHTHNGLFVNSSVGFSGSKGALYKTWKDKANHDIIVAPDDGLSTYVGWTGSSTYKTFVNLRGQSIKCNGSTSWSSDRNLKHEVHDINDPYERFFYLLRPVSYQYDLGSSGRHHIGYIAQEVEQSLYESGLTTQDFAGFVSFELNRETETDENGYEQDIENSESNYLLNKGFHQQYNLAYIEFIALNTHMIQKQYKYIQELQNDYNFIKQQLQNALAQIEAMQQTINRLGMAI